MIAPCDAVAEASIRGQLEGDQVDLERLLSELNAVMRAGNRFCGGIQIKSLVCRSPVAPARRHHVLSVILTGTVERSQCDGSML